MRKILILIIAAIFVVVPVTVVGREVHSSEFLVETAATRIGKEFTWPDSLELSDPAIIKKVLSEAASASDANVIRTSLTVSEDGRSGVTYYVYLGRQRSALFDELSLSEGRWLTQIEAQSGRAVVTCAEADGVTIVGRPDVLGERIDVTVAPLLLAFDVLPTAGKYVVEAAADDVAASRFLAAVERGLRQRGMPETILGELVVERKPAVAVEGLSTWALRYLPHMLAIFAVALFATVVARGAKAVSVMRVCGLSLRRIWYRIVGPLYIIMLGIGLVSSGFWLAVLPGADSNLAWELATSLFELLGAGLLVTATAIVIVSRVDLVIVLKGGMA